MRTSFSYFWLLVLLGSLFLNGSLYLSRTQQEEALEFQNRKIAELEKQLLLIHSGSPLDQEKEEKVIAQLKSAILTQQDRLSEIQHSLSLENNQGPPGHDLPFLQDNLRATQEPIRQSQEDLKALDVEEKQLDSQVKFQQYQQNLNTKTFDQQLISQIAESNEQIQNLNQQIKEFQKWRYDGAAQVKAQELIGQVDQVKSRVQDLKEQRQRTSQQNISAQNLIQSQMNEKKASLNRRRKEIVGQISDLRKRAQGFEEQIREIQGEKTKQKTEDQGLLGDADATRAKIKFLEQELSQHMKHLKDMSGTSE